MVKVAPSVLSVDIDKIEDEVAKLENEGADYIHIDVMDGEFVPNETDGVAMIERAHSGTNLPLDTHLMVENPENSLEDFLAFSNTITFHIESVNDESIRTLIERIHESEINVGIAIKPDTPLDDIVPYIDDIDMVLVMLVEPGFGGQKMIESCLEKVREIRKMRPEIDIEVDGGINLENVEKVKEAGANIIVSGTAIIKEMNRAEIIRKMKE